jgi:hypothetical protein
VEREAHFEKAFVMSGWPKKIYFRKKNENFYLESDESFPVSSLLPDLRKSYQMLSFDKTCGLYYKHITIVIDAASVISK